MPFPKSPRHLLNWMLPRFDDSDHAPRPSSVAPGGLISDAGSEGRRLTVATTNITDLVPREDKLLVFRSLTGIDTVPALTSPGHAERTAPNLGIYARIVHEERKLKKTHVLFKIVSNFCLGIQIVVGAAITALGAANGSHRAVTAFGAMNTIMAGVLTYLKGSGLPDRLKQQKDEWKRVREHIEQRERDFCLANCPLNVNEEIRIIEDMYQDVKARLESAGNPAMQNRSSFMGSGQGGGGGDRYNSVRYNGEKYSGERHDGDGVCRCKSERSTARATPARTPSLRRPDPALRTLSDLEGGRDRERVHEEPEREQEHEQGVSNHGLGLREK